MESQLKEFLIIRHARSKYNIGETYELNSGLSPFGEHQAKVVGEFLTGLFNLSDWTIYTSPFARCLATTELLINHYNRNSKNLILRSGVIVEPLLYEHCDHDFDHTNVEIKKPVGGTGSDFYWRDDSYEFEFNETNTAFIDRLNSFIDNTSDKTLVVSHGLPILTLIKIITQNANFVPCWDYSVDNTSITWIQGNRCKWYARNLHFEGN